MEQVPASPDTLTPKEFFENRKYNFIRYDFFSGFYTMRIILTICAVSYFDYTSKDGLGITILCADWATFILSIVSWFKYYMAIKKYNRNTYPGSKIVGFFVLLVFGVPIMECIYMGLFLTSQIEGSGKAFSCIVIIDGVLSNCIVMVYQIMYLRGYFKLSSRYIVTNPERPTLPTHLPSLYPASNTDVLLSNVLFGNVYGMQSVDSIVNISVIEIEANDKNEVDLDQINSVAREPDIICAICMDPVTCYTLLSKSCSNADCNNKQNLCAICFYNLTRAGFTTCTLCRSPLLQKPVFRLPFCDEIGNIIDVSDL